MLMSSDRMTLYMDLYFTLGHVEPPPIFNFNIHRLQAGPCQGTDDFCHVAEGTRYENGSG